MVEISDIWGWVVALGLSCMLAEGSFKNGRHAYRLGFYLSGGNLFISLFMFFSEGGVMGGGWREGAAMLITSSAAYFAYLGVSITFRSPRSVKCFRCQYVGYPSETEEIPTEYVKADWQAFRKLDAESKTGRHAPLDR